MEPPVFFALCLTVCLWGSAFVAIRICLKDYGPGHLALLRFISASIALGAFAFIQRMRMPDRRDYPLVAMAGFFGIFAYQTALNYGELSVTAGVTSLIVNSCPIFTALLALFILRERLKVAGWIGVSIGFCGTLLISLNHVNGFKLAPGIGLLVLAANFWGGYIIVQKPSLKKYTALQFTSYAIWAGTIFLMIFLPGLADKVRTAPLNATLGAVYLGLFPTAIGYVTWGYVLSRTPASIAASFLYFVPAASMFFEWLYLGEVPSAISLVGGAVIIFGVFILNAFGKLEKPVVEPTPVAVDAK